MWSHDTEVGVAFSGPYASQPGPRSGWRTYLRQVGQAFETFPKRSRFTVNIYLCSIKISEDLEWNLL